MTREEILAITESDKEGCKAINKLVHEKLGLCWHEWDTNKITGWSICSKCKKSRFSMEAMREIDNPDYTHDIKACWQIKEWLDKQPSSSSLQLAILKEIHDLINDWPLWASPLDRCKAFLLMGETK